MSSSVVFSGNGEVVACGSDASVVVSGIGEEELFVGKASVVAYGDGKEDACKGEEDACKGKDSVVVSGQSKYAVKSTCTAEYPCVRRLRERRLLSFLFGQGFHGAFEALTHETAVLFSVQHMRRLVKHGRWEDALMYLNTFLPPLTDNHRRSNRAQIFHTFLLMHFRFARVLAGNKEKCLDKQYAGNRWSSSDAELRFRSITYSILASEPHQLRASYDWDKVRAQASFLVLIMAHTTPELRRSTPLPSSYMMPQQVLPIGSGLHRRRHHVVKKQGTQLQNRDAIFMALKSQYRSNLRRDSRVETPNDAMELLVDYLDQTLKAGLRRGCNLSYAPQPSVMEGVPYGPCVQTIVSSSTDNAKGHATSSMEISGAPICQTISGTLKVHSKSPGISLVTNAGTNKRLMQAGCRTENPSEGPTTVEDDTYPKKQRTTGVFGEASSVSVLGGCASADTLVNFMPKLSRACSL